MADLKNSPLTRRGNRILKRVFDIFFSGLVICTLFPIAYIIVGAAVKLSSPGPVLFRQRRTGLDGGEFWCYKFRTMQVNAHSDTLSAAKNDSRITVIGSFLRRTGIDELPQFINVLIGDMSVIGPRPHMLMHTDEYRTTIDNYMLRHIIKPGITGWAQVNGSRGTINRQQEIEDRVGYDIWYIRNWTLGLDISIFLKTIRNMVLDITTSNSETNK